MNIFLIEIKKLVKMSLFSAILEDFVWALLDKHRGTEAQKNKKKLRTLMK